MGDLAQVIARGTDQMSGASQGLARVIAASGDRKAASLKALTSAATDAMGEATNAFKQYGDWKTARASEDDVKAAGDAARLGRIHSGAAGALTALDAYKPATVAGLNEATALRKAALAEGKDAADGAYQDVQAAHLKAQTDEINQKAAQAKQDAADRQKFIEGGGISLGPDASPTEVQTVHDILGGVVSVKQAKPILDMERDRRKAAAVSAAAGAKVQAKQADTQTFDSALAAYNRNDPILDPTTGAYRQPTEADRMAAVDAVDGLTPKHRQVIAQLSQRRMTDARLTQLNAEHMNLERQKFTTQTAAATLRNQLAASGQDARAVLAANANARAAAENIVAESQKNLALSQVQRQKDAYDPALTPEVKAQRQKERDASDAQSMRDMTEYGTILKGIAGQGGKDVAPAPQPGDAPPPPASKKTDEQKAAEILKALGG